MARTRPFGGVAEVETQCVPVPPLVQLQQQLLTDDGCMKLLLDSGIISMKTACSYCGGNVSLRRVFYVRCTSKNCRREESLLKQSFFGYYSNLSCSQALFLGYMWLIKASYTTIQAMTSHSSGTVVDYLGYFRQVVSEDLSETDVVIGGPGVIVELDESKFGKRKYNRGHRVEGVWVVGGVERTEARKCFAVAVEDRTAATLCDIISRYVAPGSIIHTDCWKGYQLQQFVDVTHFTVNHSENFVDPDTGVHTNSIEGTWNGFKTLIPARRRTKTAIGNCLLEFIWRRRHKDDLWGGFLRALKNVRYD